MGQPYGVIFGKTYKLYDNGTPNDPTDDTQRLISASGRNVSTSNSDNVIGDPNPDWTGGVMNKLSYKNWALSFLVDIQHGGDIFSLDLYYGLATGLYEESVGLNDLGNPVRDPLTADATSGGIINQGVTADGQPNTKRVNGNNYLATGYAYHPQSEFIYDASYVKLREVSLSYSFPKKWLTKTMFEDISLSFVGNNLWIISKNLPHADPESGLGAGNLQGYSISSLPSTKDFSFNLNVRF
ncbi:MAG: hypothetical protein IPP15_12385 [Saprospiraceae bacterium]|uniref:TonB-dependent receptor-like beta-barrel domain-containing protein n=1 Tax=Candidatus Opimibacter skivensis TaxID=2982028 RepID=A0A9D7SW19_9BACT|nr:hypothetical protein [Candidatus Opimibacter skivensis]